MSPITSDEAAPYVDAGCSHFGGQIIGSAEQVTAGLIAVISGRSAKDVQRLAEETGVGSEWFRFAPIDILKDAGWGTDRATGKLAGGPYEVRRAQRLVATLFGE